MRDSLIDLYIRETLLQQLYDISHNATHHFNGHELTIYKNIIDNFICYIEGGNTLSLQDVFIMLSLTD